MHEIKKLSERCVSTKVTIPVHFIDGYLVGMITLTIILRQVSPSNEFRIKEKSYDKLRNLASGKFGLQKKNMYSEFIKIIETHTVYTIPSKIIAFPTLKARRRIIINDMLYGSDE